MSKRFVYTGSVVKCLAIIIMMFAILLSTVYGQKRSLHQAVEAAAAKGFSGAVLTASKGKIQLYSAVGFRYFETKTILKKDDVFEMASVSKQFTAMIILMLVEKGKLALDDKLTQYIDLPYEGITLRHLLTHTSGLPDYQEVMDAHWDKQKVANNQDIIAYLKQYRPPVLFAPGDKYNYSNTGYVMLASIAEKASQEDFVALCNNWIFSPTSMKSTAIRTNAQKAAVKNFAAGHLQDSNAVYVNANRFAAADYTIWLGGRKGPGRVSSTAKDLLKWDRALYTNKYVSNALLQLAFTPQKLNDGTATDYGFGWVIKQHPVLGKYVMHTGDNPGYRTIIIRFIDADRTIIVLNNNAHETMNELVANLTKLIADNYRP